MFGAKRKARKIRVSEGNEDHDEPVTSGTTTEEPMNDAAAPDPSPSSVKFTRKPFKGSSLRKSININDDSDSTGLATSAAAEDDDDHDDGPAVVRPAVSRSGSTRVKKKASSSRLSFGVADPAGGDDGRQQPITPKKTSTLSQRATENSALRSSLSSRKLPTRSFGPEVEETSYSKEYLQELQSSTPNTPQNIASLRIHDDEEADASTGSGPGAAGSGDAMDLDPSELEGAVVVPQADLPVSAFSTTGTGGHIPSAVEIREKKERRARLAAEGGAYHSDEDDEDYISLAPRKKKDDTRLIAEDEDLGEGYDEFVEDARLELGKKGEKEAARRHRREMAELIDAAEGGADDGDEDADSDAERTAAYEAAQTRAAMGGHHLAADEKGAAGGAGTGVAGLVIPRMRALPELGESLARMRELVRGVEEQAAARRARIAALEKERGEIVAREAEVQEVLNQAGVRYQSAMGVKHEGGGGGGGVMDPLRLAAESPLRAGSAIPPAQRGLESFGTPSRRQEYDDDDGDDAMAG
ncbi:hypothetical protein KVR01_012740 [Diaporthe batatas]|uniref:uncharacterized protein n=1 Tax=Diaporthe batatas TaxID=748121 RepID=UPI001D040526|nr:uncharacterized protein KVR01_012740 [Diaporthe batatas]KAG8157356.1 hypothetical protein KVR01_012740 [Diaporthe batatas]